MRRRISTLTAAIGISLAGLALTVSASAADYRPVKEHVDGQYIVVLNATAARLASEPNRFGSVRDVAEGMAASYQVRLLQSYDHVLRGFAIRASAESVQRMLKDPRIAYIEDDAVAHTNTTQSGADWGLDRIDQRDLPFNGAYTYTTTASNVHAYIIDTGIYAANVDFTGRIGGGYTAISDGNGTNDCYGHGTHVAGIVGGTTYGVAKGVILHPVRVLDCTGSGTASQVIAGVNWVAANHSGPSVANMSIGFGGLVSSVDTAVASLVTAGVTVSIAAGNDHIDACTESPADVPSAITVGSTRRDDGRSVFSNYGKCVDLFAPGTEITSDWNTSSTAKAVLSGTSMAAPHVTGAAALYLSTHTTATPAQISAALVSSTSPLRVLNAGAGSPTGLLYTLGGTISPPARGTAPTAMATCNGSDGGSGYDCNASKIVSASPYAIYWSDPASSFLSDNDSGTDFSGRCSVPSGKNSVPWTVDFAIYNRANSFAKQINFTCLGGNPK